MFKQAILISFLFGATVSCASFDVKSPNIVRSLSAIEDQSARISTPTATTDGVNLQYAFSFSGAVPNHKQIFLDTDSDPGTGYSLGGVGAEYLLENETLYRFSGASEVEWGWTYQNVVSFAESQTSASWTVEKTSLGSVSSIRLVARVDSPLLTSSITTQTLSASGSSPAPTGPVYYLSPVGNDSSAGTASAPWRTIQKAANTVNAGDTVMLMDGAYEEPSITFRRSGALSKPITFAAQNKWQAVLSSTSGCNPGFSINASYIRLKGIRFAVSPRNPTCGKYTSSDVHIRAWNTVQPTPENPTTGLVGFAVDGIKVENSGRSEGVKSNQDFTIIENSEFANSIELLGTRDSVIRNNLVNDQDPGGISIFVKGGERNTRIYNNVIRNRTTQWGYGIYLGGTTGDQWYFDTSAKIEAYNVVAFNNVIIHEGSGTFYGVLFAGAKDSAFLNNVVIGGSVVMMAGGGGKTAPTQNPTLKNNIFVCNGPYSGGISYTGTASIDYNSFHNCSGSPNQAHPISGDPQFKNASSDWSPMTGSPAINSGAPVTFKGYGGENIDVSRDKNGAVRTAPWDLGIYDVAP